MQRRLVRSMRWCGFAALLVIPLSAGAEPPIPDVPKPVKGEECVEPVDVMRRDHMDFLKHQRDETVHEGVRTKQYSLKECLECHVPPKSEKVVRVESEQHFCNSCHSYAAVKVDCFQCHAEQPTGQESPHRLTDRAMPHHGQPDPARLGDDIREILAAEDKGR